MSSFGQELVSVINKLQDAFNAVGSPATKINLPQICVLGSQSSGKSSVLENIVGRDFLPRGTGIVTRRPLILQLIHRLPTASQPNGTSPQVNGTDKLANESEWGEFQHIPGEKFYDFNKIRAEIVRDTESKTGRNAGISPVAINLRIYSPNVVTLTLVDLPGLTKVPVGDQPKDIEKQIKDMLLTYITPQTCIILAVTAANTDLANSDGLKLAREVDPDGKRTIGVLTKVDLMDQGTDVVDILAGRVIPLRLGYVPVVNRGQRDIDTSKSIRVALDAERNFFESHSAYKEKSQYCGTGYLSRKLNAILLQHIREDMPDIKARISQQLQKYTAELAALGGPMGDASSGNIVLSVITEFTNEFRTVLEGNTNDLSLNELSGGARISYVFHELYSNGVNGIDPFDHFKDGDIGTLLYNTSGSTPSLFVGMRAFEIIVKQQIKRLKDPSLKCCQLVYNELVRILGQLLQKIQAFRRFPALRERFNAVVINFFKTSMTPTMDLVSDLVALQAGSVNTVHPDFINGHTAMSIVQEKLNANKPPAPASDSKSGRLSAAQTNNSRDLGGGAGGGEQSFFGSFLPTVKKGQPKKPNALMEPPPAVIRPQASLNEREVMETEVLKLLIHSYFNIIKRDMIDVIPKAITLKLVDHSKDNLQRELLQELYKPDVLEGLMKESEFVVNRRKEVVGMVTALNKAEEIVAGV